MRVDAGVEDEGCPHHGDKALGPLRQVGCHSEMPQAAWPKQQKFISHGSGV